MEQNTKVSSVTWQKDGSKPEILGYPSFDVYERKQLAT
jgi:hypothetical protein